MIKDTKSLAWALMETVRGIGIERGVDVILHLLFVRWMTLNDPTGKEWGTLAAASTDDELIASFNRLAILNDPEQIPSVDTTTYVSALRNAVHELNRGIDSEQAGDTRPLVAATFDEVLGSLANLGKQAGETDTPRGLAELMVALTVSRGDTVLDPACGNGTALLIAAKSHSDVSVSGLEINRRISRRASMRLMIHGVDNRKGFGAWQGDAFFEYGPGLYDAVVMQPPWGINLAENHSEIVTALAAKYSHPSPSRLPRADMAWLLLALDALTVDGKAAVVLPGFSTDRKCRDTHRALLALGSVEAIVSMPPGVFTHTMVSTQLWLLRAPSDSLNRQVRPVLLMDAATLIEPAERGRSQITQTAIDAIVEVVAAHRSDLPLGVPDHVAGRFEPTDIDPERGMDPHAYLSDPPLKVVVHPSPDRSLLSEVTLANFKAFADKTKIPMAPLTLLYGANSAGKSSIIQALLMLKQSRASEAVQTQGPITNLGGFGGLLHQHSADSIEVGLTYGVTEAWIPAAGTPDPTLLRSAAWAMAADSAMHGQLTQSEFRFGDYSLVFRSDDGDPNMRLMTLGDAENAFLGVATGTLLYPFDARHEAGGEEKDQANRLRGRQANARRALRTLIQDGTPHLTFRSSGLLGTADSLTPIRGSERDRNIAASYVNRTARLASGVSYEIDQLLENLVWLGPLRSAPQRVYDRADTGDSTGDGRHVAMYLFDHATVVDDLNEWLRRLDIPYALDVIPVSVGRTANLVGDLVAISLTDTRSGVTVTPADVGFGISQVLPIAVELLARRESVIAIEQPETHLHPRLQARLADLLIDATQEGARSNQVVVETHSEHLMLRIQRRIREGTLDADDVSVVYVDRDEETGQAVALPLRLNEQGDFLDEWPRGFFDERLEELFGPF